jgi:hypothetical protein
LGGCLERLHRGWRGRDLHSEGGGEGDGDGDVEGATVKATAKAKATVLWIPRDLDEMPLRIPEAWPSGHRWRCQYQRQLRG